MHIVVLKMFYFVFSENVKAYIFCCSFQVNLYHHMHLVLKSCFGSNIHRACGAIIRIVNVLLVLGGPYSNKCGN